MAEMTQDYYENLKQTPGLLTEAEVLIALSEKARSGSINALTALLRWYREHTLPEEAPKDSFAAVDAAAAAHTRPTLRKVA